MAVKEIKIAHLNKRIGIKLFSSSLGEGGVEDGSYGAAVEAWAMVRELDGSSEKYITDGIAYDELINVTIRYKSSYNTTKMKISYKGRDYEVESCREVYGNERFLNIKAYRVHRS